MMTKIHVFLFFLFFSLVLIGQETYIDNFSSVSYSNNDGSSNFSSNWTESGDDNSASSGYIRITGNELRFDYLWSENIERSLDLSGTTSATLSFDWRTSGLDFREVLAVEISTNGGAYTTLNTFGGTQSNSYSVDISAYISPNTTIRFLSNDRDWESGEYAYIDDFMIQATLVTNTPPIVTATGNQNYCPSGSIPIAQTISITDSDDTSTSAVYVQISSGYINGEDLLTLTGSHPAITTSWDAVQGELTLTGPATYIQFENAILDIEYSSSALNPSGTRQFSITVGEANYLPATGHYYEYIDDLGITWTNARNAAAAKTYFGLQGYLATLTSQVEADFSGSQASGVGWIGANDATTEGVWQWVTGPESGTTFWNGLAGGSTPNFAFWNSGEPNNVGASGEDYAHITHPNVNPNGSWNDLPDAGGGGNYQPQGYVVEYGGMPGDPVLQISATTSITISRPTITSTTPNSRCGFGTVTLSATASSGTVNWYTTASGGTAIATGNNYTTPSISSNTTYYVDAVDSGCTSVSRTAIIATVLPVASATITVKDASCSINNGEITFTFPDNPDLTNIEFSLNNQSSYRTQVADNSGSVTYTNLAAGSYHLWVRSGDNSCPVDLGTYTINTIPLVTLNVLPSTQTVFAGNSITLSIVTSLLNVCQWQVSKDGGTSYTDITNGLIYSGSTTPNLTIGKIPLNMNGYLYRVSVTNPLTGCAAVISNNTLLSVKVSSIISNRRITYRGRLPLISN